MSEHPSHKLDSYKDTDRKWIVFCTLCSREEENLSSQCSGKFLPLSREISCDVIRKHLDTFNDNY